MRRPGVAFVVLAGMAASFLAGFAAYHYRLPPYALIQGLHQRLEKSRRAGQPEVGRFRPVRELSADQLREIEELRALGYLSGTTEAGSASGVVRHDPERAQDGLNLVIDGSAARASVVDMKGALVHQWAVPYRKAFPHRDVPDGAPGTEYWRRVALLPDGGLLGVYEGQGLVRIDRDSNVLWAYPGPTHHDLEILPDGEILVLTREAEVVPRVDAERPILHDFVVRLSPDGEELSRISLLGAVESSAFRSLMGLARDRVYFHTNTLTRLDGGAASLVPAFAEGNLLLSFARIDTVAVLDPVQEKIVWAMAGLWGFQHEPVVLQSGNLLVFDNLGNGGNSRAIELKPTTQQVVWSWDGGDTPLFTRTCGSVQRLGNGNTLITESEAGRALEVTPDGGIVWEYYTPHRAGSDEDLIANLFEVVRLADRPGWLEEAGAGPPD